MLALLAKTVHSLINSKGPCCRHQYGNYICDIDGNNLKQITHLGKANWAAFFSADGKKLE
jgi:hypothetical protein